MPARLLLCPLAQHTASPARARAHVLAGRVRGKGSGGGGRQARCGSGCCINKPGEICNYESGRPPFSLSPPPSSSPPSRERELCRGCRLRASARGKVEGSTQLTSMQMRTFPRETERERESEAGSYSSPEPAPSKQCNPRVRFGINELSAIGLLRALASELASSARRRGSTPGK